MTTIQNRNEHEPVRYKPENKKERRKYRRFACKGPAEVAVFNAGFLFRGEIRDISSAGCYVQTKARLRLHRDDEVEMHFTLGRSQVKCFARVKSLRPGKGAGFEFVDVEGGAAQSIKRLIGQIEEAEAASEEKPAAT